MTAATSAWASVSGPSCAICDAERPWPATRINATVPTSPTMAQTSVDTSFGLIAESLARSGLSAEAWTVRPTVVRLRNHANAIAIIGDHDDDRKLGARDLDARQSPRPGDRDGVTRVRRAGARKGRGDGQGELGDPDGCNEDDDPRGVEQPADHRDSTRAANIVPTRSAKGAATQKGVW